VTASRDGLAFSGRHSRYLPGSAKVAVNRRTADAKATCNCRRTQFLLLAQTLRLRCIDNRLTPPVDSACRGRGNRYLQAGPPVLPPTGQKVHGGFRRNPPGCDRRLAGAAMQDIVTEPNGRAVEVAKRRTLAGLVILAAVIALPGCSTVNMQHMRPAPPEPPPYTGYMTSLPP
jgi:hypothetical protein